jgi:hypothetical protein
VEPHASAGPFRFDEVTFGLYFEVMMKLIKHAVVSAVLLVSPLASTAAETKSKSAKAAPEFVCTEIIGVSVTGDWFDHGFENGIDGGRWQARWRKHAFVEQWANPADELWSMKADSPCSERSDNPDRVFFTGVNWEYKTSAEWKEKLTAVVEVLRKKYPGLKRIELLTMLRAPGNHTCGDDESIVAPYIDEAVAAVAKQFAGLVVVGPKVETDTCDVFTKGGPHFTEAGMPAVAKTYQKALGAH